MVGVTLQVDTDVAVRALDRLTTDQMEMMVDRIATMVEAQTRERLDIEKSSPEGVAWAPWSRRYAASLAKKNRVTARSLLIGEENLLKSIQNYHYGLTAEVGTNVPYGAIHQFGGRGIPARPYLGLSGENRDDIEALVIGRIEDLVE